MNYTPIETKQDSVAKLAQAAGKPTANYLFAPEFNEINERTIQAYIDRMAQTATFHWGDKGFDTTYEEKFRAGENGFDRVHLLQMRLESDSIFNVAQSVTLVLERYKKKRRAGSVDGNTAKPSGWRTPNFSEDENSMNYDVRKAQIEITSKESLLDFKQEYFFEVSRDESGPTRICYIERVKGQSYLGSKSGGHYIRFRLLVNMGGKIYKSVPTQVVKLYASVKSLSPDLDQEIILSYQLT